MVKSCPNGDLQIGRELLEQLHKFVFRTSVSVVKYDCKYQYVHEKLVSPNLKRASPRTPRSCAWPPCSRCSSSEMLWCWPWRCMPSRATRIPTARCWPFAVVSLRACSLLGSHCDLSRSATILLVFFCFLYPASTAKVSCLPLLQTPPPVSPFPATLTDRRQLMKTK
jgi:hypothetical protein